MANTSGDGDDSGNTGKSLPRLFIKRITMLSAGFSVIVSFFYAIGNFQDFLDETQFLLLSLIAWSSLFSIGFSIIGMVVVTAGKRRETVMRRVWSYLGYFSSLAVSLALVAVSYFLRAIIRK